MIPIFDTMNSKRQSNLFHFKKFSINHQHASLKVGTDAVLLGAWVNVSNAERVLDIGTGSGVIALMLAQRSNDNTVIEAVEVDQKDAEQARENVLHSPWPNKVVVHCTSIQEFESRHPFDLIVSNPPYFVNSLLPPNAARAQARHTQSLSAEELLEHSLRLLCPTGRIAVILPTTEGNSFKAMASSQLHLVRETAFFSRNEKSQERWLLEFSRQPGQLTSNHLVLYDSANKKSEAYVNLTKDFYL